MPKLTPQQKAARTTKRRHGKNFFKDIGSEGGKIGGKISRGGGGGRPRLDPNMTVREKKAMQAKPIFTKQFGSVLEPNNVDEALTDG